MKNIALLLFLAAVSATSCSSAFNKIFGPQTPHEQYADKLEDKGLDDTPEGRAWLAASKKALDAPYAISLPYRQNGYFGTDKPRALGLQLQAKQGERITFDLTQKEAARFALFADVYRQDGATTSLLLSADTAQTKFYFDAKETGTYILRLQPQLHQAGSYSLSISVGPSLHFPVSGSKAKTGSFWGASRDGGKRKHEGIDIFAPKHTPAVAAADGYITGVREGGIGGKVVWMKPNDRNIYLYYAHLDKQMVQEGQVVKKGDVVGLVGNTGNAQHTPAHLHFGVYTQKGPIDPLPFVNQAVKKAPDVAAKNLAQLLQLTRAQKTKEGTPVKAQTILVPLAVTAKGYLAELPDGNLIEAPFSAVKAAPKTAAQSGSVVSTPVKKAKGF